VSLGFPRLARAGVAAGLAVASLALNAASTSAATSGVRSQEWWLQKLHVTQAWHSTRGGGATVAVLDTGVYPKQADLRGAVSTGPDYTHSGRVSGGPFWGIHGTAIASLIAGRGHGPNAGAGMMGTVEFNSSCFYRYANIDIDSYRHSSSHGYRHADIHSHRYSSGHCYRNSDIHSYGNSNSNSNGYLHSNSDIHSYRYSYCHTHFDCNAYGSAAGGAACE